jgi:hypothetical protein
MIHGSKLQLKDSYEWGCEVYVKIPQADKLEAQAKSTRWIGHMNTSDGHYIYWPESCKVSVERNILFLTQE